MNAREVEICQDYFFAYLTKIICQKETCFFIELYSAIETLSELFEFF